MGCRITGRESSIGDFSAVITGLLLGLVLPPGLPLWMVALGGLVAVAPGKLIFGGLGFNVFNPALVGRAFLQAAFPVAITTYRPALTIHRFTEFIPSSLAWPLMKAVRRTRFSGATPLMQQKFDHVTSAIQTAVFGRDGRDRWARPRILLVLLCGLT